MYGRRSRVPKHHNIYAVRDLLLEEFKPFAAELGEVGEDTCDIPAGMRISAKPNRSLYGVSFQMNVTMGMKRVRG